MEGEGCTFLKKELNWGRNRKGGCVL